jgi:hypothetical protein
VTIGSKQYFKGKKAVFFTDPYINSLIISTEGEIYPKIEAPCSPRSTAVRQNLQGIFDCKEFYNL